LRPLVAPALRSLALLAMRTEEDAERVRQLGAPADRVRVTGNLKFDGAGSQAAGPDLPWAGAAGLTRAPWLVLASTAEGEEPVLLEAFASLRAAHPGLRALLAPRRPERWDAVAALVERAGLPLVRRSRMPALPAAVPAGGVLLLDTLGELARLYRHADVVFVGGSLVPRGGQNLLDPAAAGRPVLHGRHVDNFRDAEEVLLREGGSLTVDAGSLLATCERLLGDAEERQRRGAAAVRAVRACSGATARTADLLLPILDGARGVAR
jgi:3-deoxy-D-manno-octulosonic-acid transferase